VEVVVIIPVRKFGEILISRPAGREAALIMTSSFRPGEGEPIELDFAGVKVVAPSWLDEVLTALRALYGDRVLCLPTDNTSVIESLKTLEESGALG
jgi:hypothetical protein